MNRYLLDTNIVSALVRDPQGSISSRIAAVGGDNVCTSIVVAAELRYGIARRNSPRLTEQVERILAVLDILPIESPVDEVYARLRLQCERDGQPVGGNDLLIAAQALSLDLVLVTDNTREFSRFAELSIENWLRA